MTNTTNKGVYDVNGKVLDCWDTVINVNNRLEGVIVGLNAGKVQVAYETENDGGVYTVAGKSLELVA